MATATWDLRQKGLKATFCTMCGSIMSQSGDSNVLSCKFCGHSLATAGALESKPIISRSVLKHQSLLTDEDTKKERPLADEVCDKCGNPQMFYTTAQLRSADEGQTIFYECPRCKHKFSVNA